MPLLVGKPQLKYRNNHLVGGRCSTMTTTAKGGDNDGRWSVVEGDGDDCDNDNIVILTKQNDRNLSTLS